MKKTLPTIILVALIFLNLAFIFGNSLQKAGVSNKISEGISKKVVSITMPDSPYNASGQLKTEIEVITDRNTRLKKEHRFNELLRQSFHAIEFFPLGLFLTLLAAIHTKRDSKTHSSIFIGFLFLCLFAITDEVVQIFVDGRAFQTADIFVDCVGGFVGILIAGMIVTLMGNENSRKVI